MSLNLTDDGKGVFVELVGQQWNHFDIPVTDFKGLDLTSIFQMKFSDGNPELTTFAIDNLYFYRTTQLEDSIAPTNLVATMKSADYFSVTLECSAFDESGLLFYNIFNYFIYCINSIILLYNFFIYNYITSNIFCI